MLNFANILSLCQSILQKTLEKKNKTLKARLCLCTFTITETISKIISREPFINLKTTVIPWSKEPLIDYSSQL